MAGIFEFGFREFARLRQSAIGSRAAAGGVAARHARGAAEGDRPPRAQPRDARHRRQHQPVRRAVRYRLGHHERLFASLGNVQQATLAMVAPGISEALVATAIGLFAAIPAVVAYNRFADQVTRLELRFDAFIEEFSTILQRHAARAGTARRHRSADSHGTDLARPAPDGRDQRRAVHRRHAGAVDHLHDHGAAADTGRQGGSAEGRPRNLSRRSRSHHWCCPWTVPGGCTSTSGPSRSGRSMTRPWRRAPRATLQRNPTTQVLVKADSAVAYGRVVQAMVMLQRAGARKVGLHHRAAAARAAAGELMRTPGCSGRVTAGCR